MLPRYNNKYADLGYYYTTDPTTVTYSPEYYYTCQATYPNYVLPTGVCQVTDVSFDGKNYFTPKELAAYLMTGKKKNDKQPATNMDEEDMEIRDEDFDKIIVL